jgi:sulfoacetaldehyde acetyltransferase
MADACGFLGKTANSMEELTSILKEAITQQMENNKTTFIEVMLNQELGEPFRRDAMKAPEPIAGISKDDMKAVS